MKILLIASYLPYPLINGGNIRLFNILKQLQKEHEVTLIAEIRPHQTAADVKEVEKICRNVITVQRKKQWSLRNVITSGLSNQSFLVTGHTLPEMRTAIERELAQQAYDLVHVETFYVLQNVPRTPLPIVLVEHNIEYLVYQRFAEKAFPLLRPLLMLDVQKIKREEQRAWKRATAVVTVSTDEKTIIGQHNVYVVPNGVDLMSFSLKKIPSNFSSKKKTILYIGDFKWIQNRDAAAFIIKELWPTLSQKLDALLWIVGRHMPESLKELGKNNDTIIFDDNNTMATSDIFKKSDLLLAPKRVGGGTSYKLLESLAVGTPVITNNLGIEGLALKPEQDVLIGETPEELINQTIRVLSDEVLYKALASSGREAVGQSYRWESIVRTLQDVYRIATK